MSTNPRLARLLALTGSPDADAAGHRDDPPRTADPISLTPRRPVLAPPKSDWTRPQPRAPRAPVANAESLRQLGGLDSEVLALTPGMLSERVGVSDVTAREWRRLRRVP